MSSPVSIFQKISRDKSSSKTSLSSTIVLLHGWGFDSRIWEPLVRVLNQYADIWLFDLHYQQQTVESLCESIIEQLPKQSVLMGWSLGGMLATHIVANQLADKQHKAINALLALATNSVFVADEDWPLAMPQAMFTQFLSGVRNNTQRQLKRFSGLVVQGDANAREHLKYLQQFMLSDQQCAENLIAGLQLLAALDNRNVLSDISIPNLFLFGEYDALVPSDVVNHIRDQYKNIEAYCLKDQGHFLHHAQSECCQHLQNFLEQLSCD